MPREQKKRVGSVGAAVSDPVAERLSKHAQAHWPHCQKVLVEHRRGAMYIAAKVKGEMEPVPLCRLRALDPLGPWEFGFYSAARDKYEPSLLPSGKLFGTLEECFDCAASLYLQM